MYNAEGIRPLVWQETRIDLLRTDVYLKEHGLFDFNIACLVEGVRRGDPLPPVQLVRVGPVFEIAFQGHHTCWAYFVVNKPLPAIVVAEKDRLSDGVYPVRDATIVEAPLECVKAILCDKAYRIPKDANIPKKLLRKHRPYFNPEEGR